MRPDVIGQFALSTCSDRLTRTPRRGLRGTSSGDGYRRDEVVLHQGDPGDRLHIVESGRIRIGIASED